MYDYKIMNFKFVYKHEIVVQKSLCGYVHLKKPLINISEAGWEFVMGGFWGKKE